MTVKIKNKEIYEAYLENSDNEPMALEAARLFLNDLNDYSYTFEDPKRADEIKRVIDAIFNDEKIELVEPVEPKYFCYIEIPNCAGLNALQISHGNGYGSTFIHLGDFYTYNDCQFTQSEVDELKADYPYIQTKEVED